MQWFTKRIGKYMIESEGYECGDTLFSFVTAFTDSAKLSKENLYDCFTYDVLGAYT